MKIKFRGFTLELDTSTTSGDPRICIEEVILPVDSFPTSLGYMRTHESKLPGMPSFTAFVFKKEDTVEVVGKVKELILKYEEEVEEEKRVALEKAAAEKAMLQSIAAEFSEEKSFFTKLAKKNNAATNIV